MAKIYHRGQLEIRFFAQYFFPHLLKYNLPPFHLDIYQVLRNEKRIAIAAPRSFAKSTIVDVIYTLWLLLYSSQEDVLIVSASGSLAVEWVRKVKFELEMNSELINFFGDMKSDKWTQDHIILRNGNQLRAKGRGYQIRGFRPTRVILDDLEDDEMVRSKDQRDKLKDWFSGALLNTLEPNQQLVYIGTLLHPLSLLKQIVDEEDPMYSNWSRRKYKAITDGKSIWEDKWPLEKLLERKAEIGPQQFEAEYQNNPMADSTVVFHPDTYKYFEGTPTTIDSVITGFDLIGSTRDFQGKDYVAFVTLGKASDGNVYCLNARRGHWTQEEVLHNFIELYEKYKPDAFVGEEIAFQQQMHEFLLREGRKRNIYLPIRPIKLGSYNDDTRKKAKDKVSRALTVQHIFTQGLFHIRKADKDFYEELSTFPSGDYDDMVDAMVHALHVLTDKVAFKSVTKGRVLSGIDNVLRSFGPKERFKKDGIILGIDNF